jgi:hypothetical protein
VSHSTPGSKKPCRRRSTAGQSTGGRSGGSSDGDGYDWDGFWSGGAGRTYSSGSTSGYGYGYGYSGGSYSPPGRIPAIVDRETALEIVEAGRRALARKHHPDAGGSNELMAKINSISDWLEDYLKSVLPQSPKTGRR